MTLCLRQIDHRQKPFEYCVYDRVFAEPTADAILEWMKTGLTWDLVETDFYEQFEFRVDTANIPEHLKFLASSKFRSKLSKHVSESFCADLDEQCQLVAHKLLPGQRIGIHNDVVDGGETHRFTVQFNSGLSDLEGGYFMLFDTSDATDVHRILEPANNSAIAFRISEESNHAVSEVHGGVRYSMVFSFRER